MFTHRWVTALRQPRMDSLFCQTTLKYTLKVLLDYGLYPIILFYPRDIPIPVILST